MELWTGWLAPLGVLWGVLMFLLPLLFWAGLIALIVWGVMQLRGGSTRKPLDILKERYARGEINREEYERLKRELSG